MKHPDIGSRGYTTGDINLAACLMSVGVPLDPVKGVSLTLREGGGDYGSFHLLPQTVDGKRMTAELMGLWGNPETATHGDPFADLMQFVKDRPDGCVRSSDWIDHAHAWLLQRRARPIDSPRRMDDIGGFVARHQEDLAGYIFSFPHNREVCWLAYKGATPSIYMNHGPRMTLVSTALPKHVRNELLSRLRG